MNSAPGDIGRSERTVAEAVAAPVASRRGPQSPWVEALMELGALDRAVYQTVANDTDRPPRPTAAAPVTCRRRWRPLAGDRRRLGGDSQSAWPPCRQRSGDLSGRHRDHRQPRRQVDLPTSTSRSSRTRPHAGAAGADTDSSSFPSGHSATSFAFAYTVGRHLPVVGIPIRLLAARLVSADQIAFRGAHDTVGPSGAGHPQTGRSHGRRRGSLPSPSDNAAPATRTGTDGRRPRRRG